LRSSLYCVRADAARVIRLLSREVPIRTFGVGLLALATVAAATAASFLMRRRRVAVTAGDHRRSVIDSLYAAGL